MPLERLQKILSARGTASRRKAEEYLTAGLVKVNGKVATLGQKADPSVDTIEVDGKVLEERQEMLYYLLYKPVGIESTNVTGSVSVSSSGLEKKHVTRNKVETRNKTTVRDILPENLRGKIFPVGRLDKDSEGLMIFTNDGVLAYRLTHPKFDHEKEYEVILKDPIFDGALKKIREGVKLDDVLTKPAKVERTGESSFRIAITEGRNRQIRRMCSKVGSEVISLKRIRIMTLMDEKLKPGAIRLLTSQERSKLLASVGL